MRVSPNYAHYSILIRTSRSCFRISEVQGVRQRRWKRAVIRRVCGGRRRARSGASAPRRSRHWTRETTKYGSQDRLIGTGRWQMQADLRFYLDHAGRDLHEPKSQSIELRHTPDRALRHGRTQGPQQPVGASVEEQAELVGGCLGAGGAVSGEMTLPGLDMIFGTAAPAIDMPVTAFSVCRRRDW